MHYSCVQSCQMRKTATVLQSLFKASQISRQSTSGLRNWKNVRSLSTSCRKRPITVRNALRGAHSKNRIINNYRLTRSAYNDLSKPLHLTWNRYTSTEIREDYSTDTDAQVIGKDSETFFAKRVFQEFTQAKQALADKTKYKKSDIKDMLVVGFGHMTLGELKIAETILDEVIKLDHANMEAHQLLASVYMDMGEYSRAIHHSKKVLKKEPDNQEMNHCLGKAIFYTGNRKKWHIAKEYVEKASKMDPKDLATRETLAQILGATDQFMEAKKHYLYLLDKNPDDVDLLNKCGYAFAGASAPARAIECFMKVEEIEPENKDALKGAAEVCSMYGELRRSVEYFQKYLKVEKEDFSAFNKLGMLWYMLDEHRTCLDHFATARNYFKEEMFPLIAEQLNTIGTELIKMEHKGHEAKPYFDLGREFDAPSIVEDSSLQANVLYKLFKESGGVGPSEFVDTLTAPQTPQTKPQKQ